MADDPPTGKRSRVLLACRTCRDRKTRCDGRQPVCTACEHRGVGATCSFEQPPKRRKKAQASQSVDLQSMSGRSGPSEISRPEVSGPVHHSDVDIRHSADPTLSAGQARTDDHPGTQDGDDIDGLATLPSYGYGDNAYGPSSAIRFTRGVMSLLGDRAELHPQGLDTGKGSKTARDHPREAGDSVLPLRRSADEFLRCYLGFSYPLFPVLDRASFSRQYEALWMPADHDTVSEDRIFLATLNMVFALGCRFSVTIAPDQQDAIAEQFLQRSRNTYSYDLMDRVTLSHVQLLLLTAVYLQSSHSASACWNTVGLAVRVAQSISLHTPSDYDDKRSRVELQLRRKVWHSCVSLERYAL